MSIEISANSCIGCGHCTKVCPGSLLRINAEGKAYIKYPRNCWGCASCIKECPTQAIALFLGEDIGGLGGKLFVRRENTLLHWNFKKPDGSIQTISVDSKSANKY